MDEPSITEDIRSMSERPELFSKAELGKALASAADLLDKQQEVLEFARNEMRAATETIERVLAAQLLAKVETKGQA